MYILIDQNKEGKHLPRGGGRPVTSVNLLENIFLSDATTPSKLPRFCPSKPVNDHKFFSSNHSKLPTPTPNLLSTPKDKMGGESKFYRQILNL